MIEIDGIRLALESPCSEAGDYISDKFWDAIELATDPRPRNPEKTKRLANAVIWLNRNLDTTTAYMREAGLTEVYDLVIAQLNEINVFDLNVDILQPTIKVHDGALRPSYSFIW